jgi:hypothetical protein
VLSVLTIRGCFPIAGSVDEGEYIVYPELGYNKSKEKELIDYGIQPSAVEWYRELSQWEDSDSYRKREAEFVAQWGDDVQYLCHMQMDMRMNRLGEEKCTLLGHYAGSIRDMLWSSFGNGVIVDYGCGAWVDASAFFAGKDGRFTVQLVDVKVAGVEFSAWRLRRLGVPFIRACVDDVDSEMGLIEDEAVMAIESAAFEHVPSIRQQFPALMLKLCSGGLFLTNFTRTDWAHPWRVGDGEPEVHAYQAEAVAFASSVSDRAEFDPPFSEGNGWDLWVMRGS